jgi:hypothetical protein
VKRRKRAGDALVRAEQMLDDVRQEISDQARRLFEPLSKRERAGVAACVMSSEETVDTDDLPPRAFRSARTLANALLEKSPKALAQLTGLDRAMYYAENAERSLRWVETALGKPPAVAAANFTTEWVPSGADTAQFDEGPAH